MTMLFGGMRKLSAEEALVLADFFSVSSDVILDKSPSAGFAEASGIPFQAEPTIHRGHAQIQQENGTWHLRGITVEGRNVHALEIQDDSMNAAGLLPGDIVFFSIHRQAPTAREGDLVILQHYTGTNASTLVRRLQGKQFLAERIGGGVLPIAASGGHIIAKVIGAYRLL